MPTPEVVLPWVQAGGTTLAILVVLWIVRELTGKEGSLAPRWYADQEHESRLKAEERADKSLDLAEALEKKAG